MPLPPSRVLASNLVSMNVTPGGSNFSGSVETEYGWARLALATGQRLTPSTNGRTLLGQPVTGFWVNQLVNGNMGGALANYTAAYRHKLHFRCETTPSTPCS